MIVIADDLTGAAEIAGIATRFALATRLLRLPLGELANTPVTVIDTDSRHLDADEAAQRVRNVIARVARLEPDLIYKKTDSILRGPVRAELEALMEALERRTALLVPQNPSRGRTIHRGEYRVDGVPLHLTEFARDPTQPARTSHVLELLGDSRLFACRSLKLGEVSPAEGITIGDAVAVEELRHWTKQVDRGMLAAGGADFFEAILEHHGLSGRTQQIIPNIDAGRRNRLIVCGSTSISSRVLIERARVASVPICPMPDGLFYAVEENRTSLDRWITDIATALREAGRALMVIEQPLDPRPGASARLEAALSLVVSRVLNEVPTTTLFAEGGATASALCRTMSWSDFAVDGELANGIVQLRTMGTPQQTIVLKPGSYTWPDFVLR
jgi:uncharacterized protein YgbK (DUF1537 family)